MNYEEREQEFLKELTNLSHKYKILIGGCGCCGSPYLADFEGEEKLNARIPDPFKYSGIRFEDAPTESIEYVYTDYLKFEKVKE